MMIIIMEVGLLLLLLLLLSHWHQHQHQHLATWLVLSLSTHKIPTRIQQRHTHTPTHTHQQQQPPTLPPACRLSLSITPHLLSIYIYCIGREGEDIISPALYNDIYTNKRYDSIGRARQHCDGAVGVRAWQCVCIMRGQRLAAAHQVRTARTKRAEQSRDWCAPNDDDDDDDAGSMMVVVVAAAAGDRYLCLTTTWPPTHHYHAPTPPPPPPHSAH